MADIRFTNQGLKDLKKLPADIQKRIVKKLQFFSSQVDPMVFSKPLINLPPATHRFRVGDYRIAFHIQDGVLLIDRIRHRKEVYAV